MSYYQSTGSPLQLVLCSFFQCATDCAILSQFWIYRKRNAEIQLKLAALHKQASDEKQGKLARLRPSAELLTMASSATNRSTERNSIELDYYGDRSAANPDNRRPLSPNLITLQEDANNAFGRESHAVDMRSINKIDSTEVLTATSPREVGPDYNS